MPALATWDEKQIALLRTMDAQGCSAREIADRMGLTRNAVLGRLHRERLARGEKPKPRPPKAQKLRTFYTRDAKRGRTPPEPNAPMPLPSSHWDSVSPDAPGLLFVEALESRHCRFPLNNALQGVYYFCGEPHKYGSPYCEHHHAICYVKKKEQDDAA